MHSTFRIIYSTYNGIFSIFYVLIPLLLTLISPFSSRIPHSSSHIHYPTSTTPNPSSRILHPSSFIPYHFILTFVSQIILQRKLYKKNKSCKILTNQFKISRKFTRNFFIYYCCFHLFFFPKKWLKCRNCILGSDV